MSTLRPRDYDIKPTDYVGVPDPRLVYVLIADREKFDKIALPETDHGEKPSGHVLSKSVDHDGVMIVFQHWLRSEDPKAYLERRRAERAASGGQA